MKRLTDTWGRILLVALFLGYYGGTTLCYHVHYESGGVIVHSHPALGGDAAPQSSHHHSRTAYQTIQQLSHILLILFAVDILLRVFRQGYARLLCPPLRPAATACRSLSPLRAPPVR